MLMTELTLRVCIAVEKDSFTGLGKRVVPSLRESRFLTLSGHGAGVHAT